MRCSTNPIPLKFPMLRAFYKAFNDDSGTIGWLKKLSMDQLISLVDDSESGLTTRHDGILSCCFLYAAQEELDSPDIPTEILAIVRNELARLALHNIVMRNKLATIEYNSPLWFATNGQYFVTPKGKEPLIITQPDFKDLCH